jgi:hypothetical protein
VARYAVLAMRRSPLLTVSILCPHFGRPVTAQRNEANERLVDCSDKDACAEVTVTEGGATVTVRPTGCPVFRA